MLCWSLEFCAQICKKKKLFIQSRHLYLRQERNCWHPNRLGGQSIHLIDPAPWGQINYCLTYGEKTFEN